ncbi:hypothetical protein XIS1_1040056 [Xenorhabdus innexi]|uniref:Uncharacterized protein n=1 Tax=Xenorhabdus innexi TaxID=290109 RepID=A0A1N6MQE4_9GAMM|nr:hypothetical protein XIS1_1040056 [Xenorhabdus innexi]
MIFNEFFGRDYLAVIARKIKIFEKKLIFVELAEIIIGQHRKSESGTSRDALYTL